MRHSARAAINKRNFRPCTSHESKDEDVDHWRSRLTLSAATHSRVRSPSAAAANRFLLLSASPVSSFLASPVPSTSSSPSSPPLSPPTRSPILYVFAVLTVLVRHVRRRYRRLYACTCTCTPPATTTSTAACPPRQSPSSSLPASHGTERRETGTSEGSRHLELPELEESGRRRAKRTRGEEEDRRWRNNKRDGQNGVMEGEKDIQGE